MSSNVLVALTKLRENLHNVGSLNNWGKKVLNQGAVAKEKMDNYTLVTLGFNDKEEREATPLVNSTTKGYLVATPEDYMQQYETISSFFNDKGERVRVVTMEVGARFECSNFELENQDVAKHPIKNGAVVYYKHDTKKFHISNETKGGAAGYSNAANQLIVVDKDCVSIDGQKVIRFEVTK